MSGEPLLAVDEPSPVTVTGSGAGRFVVVCEHAGNRIPAALGTLGLDDVERRHDVGMAHPRRDAGLIDEHRHEVRVFGELRMKPLDGHRTREPHRADQATDVHCSHATRSDLVKNRVAADDLVCAVSHRSAPG